MKSIRGPLRTRRNPAIRAGAPVPVRIKRRLAGVILMTIGVLAATFVVAAEANAARTADGCEVTSGTPSRYGTTQMSYGGFATCNQSKSVVGISVFIDNEYFKSAGATNPSWRGSATHHCYHSPTYCNIATSGPWKGHGEYCTVTQAWLYVEDDVITDRWCLNL